MAVNAGLLATREWNQPRGRLAWWAKRYYTTHTSEAKAGLRLTWFYYVRRHGELEARQVFKCDGIPLPCFLIANNKPQPKPAYKPAPVVELPLFGYSRTARTLQSAA